MYWKISLANVVVAVLLADSFAIAVAPGAVILLADSFVVAVTPGTVIFLADSFAVAVAADAVVLFADSFIVALAADAFVLLADSFAVTVAADAVVLLVDSIGIAVAAGAVILLADAVELAVVMIAVLTEHVVAVFVPNAFVTKVLACPVDMIFVDMDRYCIEHYHSEEASFRIADVDVDDDQVVEFVRCPAVLIPHNITVHEVGNKGYDWVGNNYEDYRRTKEVLVQDFHYFDSTSFDPEGSCLVA